MKVLLTDSYLMRFNAPRQSRHELVWKEAAQWKRFPGFTPLNPLARFDVFHSLNWIPFTHRPWVVTFESILPRITENGHGRSLSFLRSRLLKRNCLRLIAMSHYAARKFAFWNRGWESLNCAAEKIEVIYPNLPLRSVSPRSFSDGILELVFVGHHFARKGGVVAVRLAQEARKRRLPVRVHVVSGLSRTGVEYTDYPDASRYQPDVELLKQENVVFHGRLANDQVLELMTRCHFTLLPTIDDTFGFSVLEGFSVGTPAIATAVCALPELVKPSNGYLLSMPVDENGNWKHLAERNWEILDSTYSRLAKEAVDHIESLLSDPKQHELLSAGAIEQVVNFHNPRRATERLECIYEGLATSHARRLCSGGTMRPEMTPEDETEFIQDFARKQPTPWPRGSVENRPTGVTSKPAK